MSKFASALLLGTSLFLLAACSTVAPQPTETAVPSLTPLPQPTETVTSAPIPTQAGATDTPDIFTELNPSSTPAKVWNNIPVMPGAIAGDGNDTSYYFTTKSATDAIEAYYNTELAKIGYSSLAVGQGANGAVVLFYQNSSGATLDISLFTKADTILVMFVK